MTASELLIVEPSAWWAPALRRIAPELAVREVRTMTQAELRLDELAAQFVVVEAIERWLDELTIWLSRFTRRWPEANIAVVTRAPLRSLRWLFLEAGAAWVATGFLEAPAIAAAARRHLAQTTAAQPPIEQQSLSECCDHYWNQLPWPKAAQR